jgi:hypothetical protein
MKVNICGPSESVNVTSDPAHASYACYSGLATLACLRRGATNVKPYYIVLERDHERAGISARASDAGHRYTLAALKKLGYNVRGWSDSYRIGVIEFYWDTSKRQLVIYDYSIGLAQRPVRTFA